MTALAARSAGLVPSINNAETRAFKHWFGGSFWHHLQAGYSGHIVQVVNDFGDLVAVSGRLTLRGRSDERQNIFTPSPTGGRNGCQADTKCSPGGAEL